MESPSFQNNGTSIFIKIETQQHDGHPKSDSNGGNSHIKRNIILPLNAVKSNSIFLPYQP
jgi:hypothetical protein